MSYLIAFVCFDKGGHAYPVNCDRADIAADDHVLVSTPERRPSVKIATVERLEYLGWNCKNTILCQAAEAVYHPNGQWALTNPNPDAKKVVSSEHLDLTLRSSGWKTGIPVASTYRRAYWRSSNRATAYVLVRKHGVDLQIIDEVGDPPYGSGGRVSVRATIGRIVKHWHYGSSINIYNLAVAFALSFKEDEAELSSYFLGQGHRPPPPLRGEISQIRDAIGVDYSGQTYLSDGVWL